MEPQRWDQGVRGLMPLPRHRWGPVVLCARWGGDTMPNSVSGGQWQVCCLADHPSQ